jgi:hypothetical protein
LIYRFDGGCGRGRRENANVFKNAILSRFLLNTKEGNINYIENTKKPYFGLIIAFLAGVA